MTTVISG